MDLQANPELVFGEEFFFPATVTYYPTPYAPTGVDVPAELYEHQSIWGCDDQGLHYLGQQAEGTSCMYYVVPGNGIAHSPHGPYPLDPCAIADGRFVRAQEYLANTADSIYHQSVPTAPYAFLPSAADRAPASTSQTPAYTDGLFTPSGQGQTVPVASNKGVTWNSSLQSTNISSKKFQDHAMLPKVQLHSSVPWKQELAGGTVVPAKLSHAPQASQHSLHGAVPSVKPSPQINLSYNYHVPYVGSDPRKMVAAEKCHPGPKPRSYVNSSGRLLSSLSRQNLGKAKMPIGSMSSEIIVKSYTSSLQIGNREGQIIIRTDQYNRDDFQVLYPNAKFFVIKSFDVKDVHKSIKYGVWSSSITGNHKLDSAFRDAQVIAASSSTLCPVFLFFSVNGSSHFCGVAEMVGPVNFQKHMDFWSKNNKWIGSFPVRWKIIKNVPNSTFRWILLQNNEDKPVTSSRDTQEMHYVPGTSMLKIFKDAIPTKCLFDEFMVHEKAEARNRRYVTSKLSCDAKYFIPVSRYAHRTYRVQQPKAVSVLMDRIIRGRHYLAGKLQHANLDRHQGSREEFGNLVGDAAKAYAHKESHCYGKQAHENIVKAVTFQPLTSTMQGALDGEQQTWKKEAEVTPSGKKHPEAANISSKAPEEYSNEVKNALLHSASGTPEMTCEEQKIIGKHCSIAINSQISEAGSSCLVDVVAIGSMLIPIKMSSQ